MSSVGTWARLNALALDGLEVGEPPPRVSGTPGQLQAALDHCEAIIRQHSKTFFLASRLMPREKRRAVRALYAFCRVTDDIVDRAGGESQELADWRARAMSPHPPAEDPVCLAWAHARTTYRIPARYGEQLIDGVARDLVTTRYPDFDELATYCYGVAATVGLMSMHIIGHAGRQAAPFAIKMGVALQLTNILRDVGEDWRAGRIYLPQDELAQFGLRDQDVAEGRVNDRWRELMRFQIERTRRLYSQAWHGIALLHPHGRFAVAAAADLYAAILSDIEAHDYDVFHRRAHVSATGKLRRLPGIGWRLWRLMAARREAGRTRSA